MRQLRILSASNMLSKSYVRRPSIPPVLIIALVYWLILSLGIYFNLTLVSYLNPIIDFESVSGSFCVSALEDYQAGNYSNEVLCKIISSSDASFNGYTVNVQFSGDTKIFYGQQANISGKVVSPSELNKETYRIENINGVIKASSIELVEAHSFGALISNFRIKIISLIDSLNLDNDAKYVLQAILCGYKVNLNESDIYNFYKSSGIAHMVAVSGAHLSIVVAMLMLILYAFKTGKKLSIALEIAFVCMYMLFTGMQVSTLRAAIMVFCALSSFFFGRRSSSLNALGICLLLILFFDPHAALSISLLLSAGSTLGIVLFSSLIESWFIKEQSQPSVVKKSIVSTIALTLSANIVSLPITISLFKQISIISILTNLFTSLPFSALCILGMFAALLSFASTFLSTLIFEASGFIAVFINFLVKQLSKIPYACVPATLDFKIAILFTFLITSLLYLTWIKPKFKHVIFCTLFFVIVISYCFYISLFGTKVVMLDVGQGDSIAFKSLGKVALIDTGKNDSMLKEALARNQIYHIDLLFLTHPDNDHVGSLDALSSVNSIARVVVPESLLSCQCDNCKTLRNEINKLEGTTVYGVNQGDCVKLGNFTFKVVWPETYVEEGGNQDSLGLFVSADINSDSIEDFSGLFCGDAESDALEAISNKLDSTSFDLLKVSHHGSKKSLSNALINTWDFRYALISVGANNTYGHPSEEVLSLLEQENAQVYRTDISGDISVNINASGLNITALR